MRRIVCLLVPMLLMLAGCATTSPLATRTADRNSLGGIWEEEWPGQEESDRYRIEVTAEAIKITPLTRSDQQSIRDVYFQHKRLSFLLELDGSVVHYDLVLVDDQMLSGRAKGGERNFNEPVRWYKVE